MQHVSDAEAHAALMVCARLIAEHENGDMLILTFERIEREIARRSANDNSKSRAIELAKQSKRQKAG